ncbi:thiamine diphosphate-binding protein [Xylariales sp. PMI_506]|nr:thiamine diphosphate-binding protein [Xylariales sp. PMI_506]
MSRTQDSWDQRVALVERLDARVLTDLKQAATFPTQHKCHAASPGVFNSPRMCEVVREADLIISLDWVDLAGTLQASHKPGVEPSATIVNVSLDSQLHNGWSKDHFGHPPVDYVIVADPDRFLASLVQELQDIPLRRSHWEQEQPSERAPPAPEAIGDHILMSHLADALYSVVGTEELCIIRLPLGWKGADLRAVHPLSYLGQDGGGGLASGPGQAVGSALALKDTKYLPVAILGDGDYLMGSSALWTAARYRIPLLVIVANNASFYNDEVHQERVARARARSIQNKWIGIRIDDPLPDISQNAASLGAVVIGGQVTSRAGLAEALQAAVDKVKRDGSLVVVDVAVQPDDYSAALNKAK